MGPGAPLTEFVDIFTTIGLFAGLVAIGATLAVERLGGRLGGVLASIPTTIVPAAIGMSLGTTPEGFVAAMAAVPVGMLVDAAFLWSWRVLPRRLPARSLGARLATMTVLSLGLWFGLASVFVLGMDRLEQSGVPHLAVGITALAVLVVAGIAACRGMPPAPKGTRPVGWKALLGRGLLAAVAISVSVLITRSGAPLLGGVASVFPAIFLTTMVSLWLAQGEAVPVGAVGPIMLGSSSVGVFALVGATLLPRLGPLPGSLVTWVVAVCLTSVPAGVWLTRAQRGTGAPTQEA